MHIVIPARIAEKLQISERQVKNTLQLLDDGATIPFISRYRKERTGGLDEIQIADISGEYKRLLDLQKRKETIVGSIEYRTSSFYLPYSFGTFHIGHRYSDNITTRCR